jgi:hypothetical protein
MGFGQSPIQSNIDARRMSGQSFDRCDRSQRFGGPFELNLRITDD